MAKLSALENVDRKLIYQILAYCSDKIEWIYEFFLDIFGNPDYVKITKDLLGSIDLSEEEIDSDRL